MDNREKYIELFLYIERIEKKLKNTKEGRNENNGC